MLMPAVASADETTTHGPLGGSDYHEIRASDEAQRPFDSLVLLDAEGGIWSPVRQLELLGIVRFGLAYTPKPGSSIGLEASLSPTWITASQDGATARVRPWSFGARGTYDLLRDRHPLHLDCLFAFDVSPMALERTDTDGTASTDTLWTPLAALGLRARGQVGRVDLGVTARLELPLIQRRLKINDATVLDLSTMWMSAVATIGVRI